ncbi:replication fork protection component Swi3-domain-containing protein [Russula brevipes]|nr:replication fork protection component Swi3-domain-containing protein [Russula brevipes]
MDTDINDIWDLPVETSIRHPPVDTPDDEGLTSPPHPSNRPLFLPSDDEDDAAAPPATKPSANKDPDVDALFEGLDDVDDTVHELAPSLDLDALRREADARNARVTDKGKGGGALDGIDDGGEDGEKKKRKPVPKLDEARLLGTNGLPQLLKDTKNFKPKGKGHEATDLDRVLRIYQFWTHKLYPKTRFKETVDRVEKLCHSKRMQVALSVWRDEAKGLVNGIRLPTADNDNDSDANSDADGAPRDDEAEAAAAMAADQGASDSEDDRNRLSLSSDASHPPPSSPGLDEAAIELDALLEEEEAVRTSSHTAPTGHAWKASNDDDDAVAMDEDDDLWDALALDTGAPASAPATIPAPPVVDDDQDMWDLVHELEQEKEKEKEPSPVQNPAAGAAAAVGAQVRIAQMVR